MSDHESSADEHPHITQRQDEGVDKMWGEGMGQVWTF